MGFLGGFLLDGFLADGGRIVVGSEVEVDLVGGADRLEALAGAAGVLGAFAHDAGLRKWRECSRFWTRSTALSRGPTTRSWRVMLAVFCRGRARGR